MYPKNTVGYDEECAALLPKVGIRAQINGLHNQPKQPLCYKQDCQQEPTDTTVAREQPDD
jgi:hypothetical protein